MLVYLYEAALIKDMHKFVLCCNSGIFTVYVYRNHGVIEKDIT